MSGSAELEELERLALDLACAAGTFILAERPRRVTVAATKTTVLDVVTAMDTGSERLLRRLLAERRPDDAILGEEGESVPGTTGLTWVLDPIDGTVNYLYDLPAYAVSVAVVVGDPTRPGGWEPVAGAVANPRVGEVFHARQGGGAHVRPMHGEAMHRDDAGRRLAVTSVDDLELALVGTGFSYDRRIRDGQGALAHQVLMRVRDLRRMGSAALDLCAVGAGRLDGYYEQCLQPWDLAAGQLVVTESGGTVSGLHGEPAGYPMVVAGGAGTHAALVGLLESQRLAT